MSDNNRNRSSSHGSEENWNQEGRYDQQQHNQKQRGQQGQYGQQGHQYGNMNYDENRNRGNYSGSSYGYAGSSGQQDWDRFNQGSGSDYNQQNQGYSGNYGSEYGSQYGNRREGESGNYSGSNYGQWGQSGQRGQYGRRDDMSGYQDRNSGGSDFGSSYGTSGGYGTYGGSRNYRDYESGSGNTSGNYGSNYGSSNRGNWGNQGNRADDRGWWEKTRDEVSSWFGDEDAERRRRHDHMVSGQHKGKGPRDYRRSDERILEDACDRLSDDSFVDASEIDVKVSGSEVILTGTVESREAKRRAEDIVESISGVTNVQNNLKVNSRHDSSGLRSSDSAR